jgi:hypothetical protein
MSKLSEEVNRTKPSPSISTPWFDIWWKVTAPDGLTLAIIVTK